MELIKNLIIYFAIAFSVGAAIIGIITAIVRFVAKNAKLMLCCFLAVSMFICMFTFIPAFADETNTIVIYLNDYVVSPAVFKNEVYLRIDFVYKGNVLSFYWYDELDTSYQLYVEIWNNIECIDAGYISPQEEMQ